MIAQETFTVRTRGRGAHEITADIERALRGMRIQTGTCNVFVRHTSAALMICENADPQVLSDLEAFLARLVPDGDKLFRHIAEGVDDMPAHVRTVLTQSSITIPVSDGRLQLGTWQGVYLYEHRRAAHTRQVMITVQGV